MVVHGGASITAVGKLLRRRQWCGRPRGGSVSCGREHVVLWWAQEAVGLPGEVHSGALLLPVERRGGSV